MSLGRGLVVIIQHWRFKMNILLSIACLYFWCDTTLVNQMDIYKEFKTEDCPVEYRIPDNSRRRVMSMDPPDCKPLHLQPKLSIWPPGCFILITKTGYGLEAVLYSHNCPIVISNVEDEEGV